MRRGSDLSRDPPTTASIIVLNYNGHHYLERLQGPALMIGGTACPLPPFGVRYVREIETLKTVHDAVWQSTWEQFTPTYRCTAHLVAVQEKKIWGEEEEMASTVKAHHPYVKRVPGVCGGEPVVAGTRFPVRSIVVYILHQGMTPEEMAEHWSSLSLAQIYDALSYYYDHKEEIDKSIERNREEYIKETWKAWEIDLNMNAGMWLPS